MGGALHGQARDLPSISVPLSPDMPLLPPYYHPTLTDPTCAAPLPLPYQNTLLSLALSTASFTGTALSLVLTTVAPLITPLHLPSAPLVLPEPHL